MDHCVKIPDNLPSHGRKFTLANWEDLRHFSALARAGTLSGAARLLGVEHATIARRVEALEQGTGLKLVDRRGRRLLLTEAGERIAAIAGRMDTESMAVERIRVSAQSALVADITISAPPSYAAARLIEPLAEIRNRHPGIRLRLIGEKREASLDRREADIAIRLTRPPKGDFTISRIGEITFGLYASPAYLTGTKPEDWCFIAYEEGIMEASPQQRSLLAFAGARTVGFRASTLEIQIGLARAGVGVAMLPDFLAGTRDGLVAVAPEQPAVRREIWLAVHSDLKDSPAIRAVTAELREAIAGRTAP